MGTRTTMRMTPGTTTLMTDPILTLAQWLSPAFPVGAFAYSHGLEQLIAEEQVRTAADLERWLKGILEHGGAGSDAVLLSAAYRSEDPAEVDETARALASSKERLLETDLQGTAFCDTVRAVWGVDMQSLSYPVAVGWAAARMDVPLPATLRLYVQAFLGNLVSAAVRLVPLGQTEGQQVLHNLAPAIERIAREAEQSTLDDLSNSAFAADIAAMRHETLEHRIFRT